MQNNQIIVVQNLSWDNPQMNRFGCETHLNMVAKSKRFPKLRVRGPKGIPRELLGHFSLIEVQHMLKKHVLHFSKAGSKRKSVCFFTDYFSSKYSLKAV